jgi:hypothetical protein
MSATARTQHSVRGSTYGILSSLFQFPQGTFHQYKTDGVTEIPAGGVLTAGTVTFGVSFSSNTGITPLRLQVEVRPLGMAVTGNATAMSGVLLLTKSGTVTVSGLVDGSYHWRARIANALTGAVSAWQEFGSVVDRADFTVAMREPVLIVPGIAGTVLEKASDATEVWPNVDTMLVSPSDSYLDALALNATGDAALNGAQSTVRAAAILKSATLTVGGITLFSDDFYGNLINAFKNDGYVEGQNLFTVPYDWRLDISKSVAALATKVAQAVAASPTGKIAIVAHSMGGLLVKKYLTGISSASFLDKVVLVGVPELGAPYAFKILNYGDDLDIPIVNQDEIKKITQNMPSIYELLPSERYITADGGYIQDFRTGGGDAKTEPLAYAATAQLLMSDPTDHRNAAMLNMADTFHRSVDASPAAGTAPNVYSIMGCGKPTITGYDLYDNGVVDLERGSGDGTVPDASAMDMETSGSHNYFVLSGATGIDHTGLMSDARPVGLIKNIIDGGTTLTLPQGISGSASDCATQFGQKAQSGSSSSGNETTIEFSAHGAADLGVYDAAGDYTGVTASGTVTLGIPGSDYEKLGDNTFVLVPAPVAVNVNASPGAGSNYKVVSHAAPSGTFEMKARGYRGAAIDREVTYLSVSAGDTSSTAASASTTAELNFAGFGGNMNLRIRHGSSQGIRHPDSVLSAPFASGHRKMEWSPPH